MKYTICFYDGETLTMVKGFKSRERALKYADSIMASDPRWFLLETPDSKPILNVI